MIDQPKTPHNNLSADPKRLIWQAYQIKGISIQECRTIFLDWLFGVPNEQDMESLLEELYTAYGSLYPEHDMTRIICEGMQSGNTTERKRGRASHKRQKY